MEGDEKERDPISRAASMAIELAKVYAQNFIIFKCRPTFSRSGMKWQGVCKTTRRKDRPIGSRRPPAEQGNICGTQGGEQSITALERGQVNTRYRCTHVMIHSIQKCKIKLCLRSEKTPRPPTSSPPPNTYQLI